MYQRLKINNDSMWFIDGYDGPTLMENGMSPDYEDPHMYSNPDFYNQQG